MARFTTRQERVVLEACQGRAPRDNAQAALRLRNSDLTLTGVARSDVAGSVQAEQRLGAMLGPPGRPRPAHVMQFRPVRVEGPGDELAPERLELRNRAGPV